MKVAPGGEGGGGARTCVLRPPRINGRDQIHLHEGDRGRGRGHGRRDEGQGGGDLARGRRIRHGLQRRGRRGDHPLDHGEGGLLRDAVVRQGLVVLQLAAAEEEAHLRRRQPLLVLELLLDEKDRVAVGGVDRDDLARHALDEDLHGGAVCRTKITASDPAYQPIGGRTWASSRTNSNLLNSYFQKVEPCLRAKSTRLLYRPWARASRTTAASRRSGR